MAFTEQDGSILFQKEARNSLFCYAPANMASQAPLLLLDGNALLHRAWHAIPPLTTRDGRMVNAVYGFTMIIERLLSTYSPSGIVVAWDLPGGTFRHELYVPYKAQREKKADELYEQIPRIQEVLQAYGIPSVSAEGFEADDVLATLAEHYRGQEMPVYIVTGDRDALQLVGENVHVLFFVKGISQTVLYNVQEVEKKYGVSPRLLPEMKAIMGDSSDNLPGIVGLGEKAAQELVRTFGTTTELLLALERGEVPEKFAKKILGNEDHLRLMRRMVEVVRTVPLDEGVFDRALFQEKDTARLRALFSDLAFSALEKKYGGSSDEAVVTQEQVPQKKSSSPDAIGAITVATPEGVMGPWISILADIQQPDMFGGVFRSLMLSDGKRLWIAEHPSLEIIEQALRVLGQAENVVIHGAKAFFRALDLANVSSKILQEHQRLYDTEVIAYMLNSSGRTFPLEGIILDYLHIQVSSLHDQSLGLARLGGVLRELLHEQGMEDLYLQTEMPLISVLYGMERAGILVDRGMFSKLSQHCLHELDRLTKEIHELAGGVFNINSPSQLADILFEKLQLPTKGIKKTKTGFSTAAPELEKLWDLHPIIARIEDYRELAKLSSTYIEVLPQLVHEDGRIHAQFNQTIAATGRLSSSNPNLQNIPVRTELGRRIRHAFIAPEKHLLLSADYSQIELRLAAELAKDEALIRAFLDGADVHRRTAAEVWNISEEAVTKEQRAAAKAINFSILYGVGPRALAKSTGMQFEEARAFIAKYFAVHPGIQSYIDAMKLKARTEGYVQTIFGRRRYLPDITSGVPQLVAAAERMAMNMPIQGTQADIMKMAMISCVNTILAEGLRARLILQVHDEIIFEVHEEDRDRVEAIVRESMSKVVSKFSVPLVVDVASGRSWGEIE